MAYTLCSTWPTNTLFDMAYKHSLDMYVQHVLQTMSVQHANTPFNTANKHSLDMSVQHGLQRLYRHVCSTWPTLSVHHGLQTLCSTWPTNILFSMAYKHCIQHGLQTLCSAWPTNTLVSIAYKHCLTWPTNTAFSMAYKHCIQHGLQTLCLAWPTNTVFNMAYKQSYQLMLVNIRDTWAVNRSLFMILFTSGVLRWEAAEDKRYHQPHVVRRNIKSTQPRSSPCRPAPSSFTEKWTDEVGKILAFMLGKSSTVDFVWTWVDNACPRLFAAIMAKLANLSSSEGNFSNKVSQPWWSR